MKRLMLFAIKLYPASWRSRYAAEFEALLEEIPPSSRTLLDILKGAIGMQVRQIISTKAAMVVLTLGVSGLLAGLGTAGAITKQYTSTSVSLIPADWGNSPAAVASQVLAVLHRRTLTELVVRYGLYPEELRTTPMEDVLGKLKQAITIRPVSSTKGGPPGTPPTAFTVQFTYSDPAAAQKVVEDLTRHFDAQLIDPANLPNTPNSPKPAVLAGIGLIGGISVGLLFIFFRRKSKLA